MTARDLIVYSGLASFAVNCGLGAYVFLKNRTNPTNVFFGVFVLSIGSWSIGSSLVNLIPDEHLALLVLRRCYVSGVFVPALFVHLAYYLTGRILTNRTFLALAYLLSTMFATTVYSPLFIESLQIVAPFDFRLSNPGPIYYAFLAYFVFLVLYVLVLMYRASQRLVGLKRRQMRYIFYAHLIASAAGLNYFLSVLDVIPFPPVDDYLLVIYFGVFGYGIFRYHLMDITVVCHKGLVYGLLFGAMIPAYVMILVLEGLFTGTRQYLLSLILLMAFVVFAGLLVNLKERLQLKVGKVFFSKQHDAYNALDHFSIAMRNILDLKSLMKKTLSILSQALGIEKISIYLFDEEKDEYVLSAARGIKEIRLRTVRIMSNHLLPQYLQKTGRVLVKEELELNPSTLGSFNKVITGTLDDLESELCLPLRSQDRLIGLVNLGPKPNRALYTKDDLRNLSTLAASAASAFANAAFHQHEKETQRREKYTERAHAFETIAGGFAHEIRNPLVSIKTFLQLAPHRKDDPEFMESFRQVVLSDTDRIERLSGEVLGFARLHEPQHDETNLNNVVECSLRSIERRAHNEGVALVFEKAPDLPSVWVDSQQLQQVFVNLQINALDAMEAVGGGQLTTKTRRLAKPDGAWIQIEITDTGTGIPADMLDTIFVPFFTTKHASREREGTGLGLSICQRIVEAHGGYSEVRSEVGHGTTFYVNLPVREPAE